MKKVIALVIVLTVLVGAMQTNVFAAGSGPEAVYEKGMGCFEKKEYDDAFSYFYIAGEARHYAPAENMLGVCCRDGLGTEQDLEEAERYFKLSADQGYEPAQENLAVLEEVKSAKEAEKRETYQNAINLYFDGKYEEARAAFESLGDYERSADFIGMCDEAMQEPKEEKESSVPTVLVESTPAPVEETQKPTQTPQPTQEQTISKIPETVKVGDTVTFGSYEQDNNTANGKEDIEWLVLAKESNKILVVSRYALDCQPYNNTLSQVTWETCSLRKWLNGTFLNKAFSEKERARIPTVSVSADKNPSYSTSPGNSTRDQVFLLSITEANKYFSTESARQCQGTTYCYAQGASKSGNGNCWWWLRSPGIISLNAAYVYSGGSVYSYGTSVNYGKYAVRPALWITLDE